MSEDPTAELTEMAELLTERNLLEQRIARLLDRPVSTGAIGEWIAERVFAIRLENAANTRSLDGWFPTGPLAGKSVNIKLYGKRDLLDITPAHLPDYYLALTGPKSAAVSSRGTHAPVLIDGVYIFDAVELVNTLHERGVHVGVASSVRGGDWEAAQIYPKATSRVLELDDAQRRMLSLFTG
jgi:hypothetical protein